MSKLLGLVAVAVGLSVPATAQTVRPAPVTAAPSDRLRLQGSIRLRFEMISGQARAGFNSSDDLLSIRTILSAEYDIDAVRIGAELYDSRAYGADDGTPLSTGEVNTLELVQAYVATSVRPFGTGSKLDLQAGRFVVNIGSRRLVAADDYRNTTNGYTGVRADVSTASGIRTTLIYVLPQSRRPDDLASLRDQDVAIDRESFDLVLWGGTASKAKAIGPATVEFSYFHLGERDSPGRPTRDRSLDTYGGRIIRDPAIGRFDFEVEGFRQTGWTSTGLGSTAASEPVDAWFGHVDAGYSFAGPWRPRLSVEYDQASGDRPGRGNGRFDTLFGMRRADLAPSGLYNAIGRANIRSLGLRGEVSRRSTDGLFAYRTMWLASKTDSFSTTGVRDATGRSGSFAGHQIDARVRQWIIADRLRFEIDGVMLFKGRFLRDAPNAPRRTTRYASINVTASF